jgi:hypothetical protein
MPNNYVLLETIALTQSAASVTFDNLPTSGYTDLKIVASIRNSRTSAKAEDYGVFFNGDTTSGNYSARQLLGSGSAASSRSAYNYGVLVDSNSATANTFGNTEIYIPNYKSSSAKSCSVDSVTENNATEAYMGLTARLWTGTAAITSISIDKGDSGENNSFVAGSTFSLYGIAALGTTPVLAPKATGGNIVANDGTYWYHAFTSSGNFVPQVGLTADVLVVAGGGGGGNTGVSTAGGGGAGGLLLHSSQSLTNGTNYACTIGAGGAGGGSGTNGVNSQFAALTASVGGGRGASGDEISYSGGSGGGAFSQGTARTGGTPTSGQGNAGGNATGTYAAGGGGGAGGAGGNASGTSVGANGGIGTSTYSSWATATNTGVSGLYAGGGASKSGNTANGGGGTYGVSGTANTGGGGGANGGATGGSGIILIRYPIN